jgi:hypothetical protein
MTFARLLLEIRRRAAALPDDGRRPQAIERIAREILADIPEGEQSDQVRRILAAFLGLGEGGEAGAIAGCNAGAPLGVACGEATLTRVRFDAWRRPPKLPNSC